MIRPGFKVDSVLKKKINKLAELVGVKLNWERECGIQYNGKDIACKNQDASNIIHDIAHYAVASKPARKRSDYGLGPGPDTKPITPRNNWTKIDKIYPIYKNSKCSTIEQRASALGIHWEKQLGLDWKATAMYHAWIDQGDFSELNDVLKSLKKIIDKYNI